ncbi:terpenoid synthase [Abortiporus biennis]|nr:terpenoid synthase [Abortiporus biennis]
MPDEVVFHIPDTLRNWPWPRSINPFYEECKKESEEWCEAFEAFSPKAQKAFNLCNFNLLASLGYPLLNKDGCRIACDLMNLFFVIDEHSDVADNDTVRCQMDCVMDALRNPHKPRPDGEGIGGEVTRSFWMNAIRTIMPNVQKRFIDAFQLYTDSVVQQAVDRNAHHIRDIKSYFEVRRDTIGAKPSFAIIEVNLNLPNKVMDHPVIKELTNLCIDMICIGNDLYSYNVEQSRGDEGHNLVTIVMQQLGLDIHDALRWISHLHDEIAAKFLEAWNHIPVYSGPLDFEVRRYTEGLGNWVRANDQWSFESERYFGKQGLVIQKNREVVLLPKQPGIGL